MKYRRKETIEAVKWFLGMEYPGLVEAGRFGMVNEMIVCNGDYICNRCGKIFIMDPDTFNFEYEKV